MNKGLARVYQHIYPSYLFQTALIYPSILRISGIWGAADEAVLNNVHKKIHLFNKCAEIS